HQGNAPDYARNPEWTWSFWSAALADLYGALFHHEWPDVVLGIVGAVFGIAGWWHCERRWAAVGAAIIVAFTFGLFLLFEFSHYFAPRYLAMAVPAMLMGGGILIADL